MQLRDHQREEERRDQSSLTLPAHPTATIEVGANQNLEMMHVAQNPGTIILDPKANPDPEANPGPEADRLHETTKSIHRGDGANQRLLPPRTIIIQKLTKANLLAQDPLHLVAKVAVAKETKHKMKRRTSHQLNRKPRNGNKNLPHRPRRLSPPTFV
jgi:hypothetical protein